MSYGPRYPVGLARFRSWLESLPADSHPADRVEGICCPLKAFMMSDQFPGGPVTYQGCFVSNLWFRIGSIQYSLPKWCQRFIRKADTQAVPWQELTPEEILSILRE